MNRETFVFYKKWAEAIKGLPSEIKLEIYESIIEYATTGKVPDLKMTAQIGFNFVKTDIDRDLEKYTKAVEKNRQNGKKGGRPKTQKNPLGFQETQPNPKNLEYDNDYEYDINVLLEKEPKYKHNNMGEGNFSEENPQTDKPPNAEPSKKVAKKKVSIPSVEEFTTYALDYIEQKKIKGTREQWKPTIETKYEAWKYAEWKDGNGKPIANWKLKIQSTIPYLKPHYGITDNGNNHHASSTQRNAPSTNGVAVSKKISARAILARELAQQNVGNEESRGFGNTP